MIVWTRAFAGEDQPLLERWPGQFQWVPCVRTKALEAMPEGLDVDGLWVMTSQTTVRYLMQTHRRFLQRCHWQQVWTVGPATALALAAQGCLAGWDQKVVDGQTLAQALVAKAQMEPSIKEKVVYLPGAKRRAFDMEQVLHEAGFRKIVRWDVYETLASTDAKLKDIESCLDTQGLVRFACFASPSAVTGFLTLRDQGLAGVGVAISFPGATSKALEGLCAQGWVGKVVAIEYASVDLLASVAVQTQLKH